MAHYGTLRGFRFSEADEVADDIRGSEVYGLNDDKLGKIDDVVFDHSSGDIRYVVVDTGGWLSTKKFLVPAERLRPSGKHEDDYQTDLDKKRVESFPPYNEADVENAENWKKYETSYRSKWSGDTIMHREATDRNITPTTSQMTKGTGATGAPEGGSERPLSRPVNYAELDSRMIPPTGNEVDINSNGMGISPRWSNFEERLRQRRHEVTSACVTCGSEPAKTASEREREPRKKAS